jgi:hypothetical protein
MGILVNLMDLLYSSLQHALLHSYYLLFFVNTYLTLLFSLYLPCTFFLTEEVDVLELWILLMQSHKQVLDSRVPTAKSTI